MRGVGTGRLCPQSKKTDQNNRSVQGVVTTAEDAPVSGGVVQLKNTKTLQIRSFYHQGRRQLPIPGT